MKEKQLKLSELTREATEVSKGTYCQIKGASATGKGTRLSQLMCFLATKYDSQLYKFEKNGKTAAIEFPSINLVIPGKIVKSPKSKLLSLTGIDILQDGWGAGFNMVDHINHKYRDWNLVCEGYATTNVEYYTPKVIDLRYKFKNQLWVTYYFQSIEQLQERIVGRSGKRIKGNCWGANKGFASHHRRVISEQCNELGFSNWINTYDEPIHIFGMRYLKWIGLGELCKEFVEWAQANPTKRHITEKQDISMWPQHLIEKPFTPPEPVSEEEYRERINTLHPKELKLGYVEKLNNLRRAFKSGQINTIYDYGQKFDELKLPAFPQMKKLIEANIPETHPEILNDYEEVINNFRRLENV